MTTHPTLTDALREGKEGETISWKEKDIADGRTRIIEATLLTKEWSSFFNAWYCRFRTNETQPVQRRYLSVD